MTSSFRLREVKNLNAGETVCVNFSLSLFLNSFSPIKTTVGCLVALLGAFYFSKTNNILLTPK